MERESDLMKRSAKAKGRKTATRDANQLARLYQGSSAPLGLKEIRVVCCALVQIRGLLAFKVERPLGEQAAA